MPTLPPSALTFEVAHVPDLHILDPMDAFRLALEHSNLSFKELCGLMGWSESFGRRVFSAEKFYPSFEDLPRFCAVVNNMIVIQWMLAKTAFYGLDPARQSVDCRNLLLRITDIFSEVGDVASEVRLAVQDNLLEPNELRRLLAALQVVLRDGMELTGDLRAQLQQQGAQRG